MTNPILTKSLFCFLFLFNFLNNSFSQTIEDGIIFDEISGIISGMPGSSGDDYADPDNLQLDKWNQILDELLNGNYADAALLATDIDYELVEYTDLPSNKLYYVLRNTGSNYWGTYVYNPNYCRSLVIQASHPKHDFNTGKQGMHVFQETDALLFTMAGTHRCNHQDSTACSGSTKVCNEEGDEYSHKFRISDMAHSATTIFQATTQQVFNQFNDSYFVSLHGFTKKISDPYVILSNGTQLTPMIDYIDILDDMLFAEDNTLSFQIAHLDNWDRLIGTTNTQGRYINASNDICMDAANSTSGRFIHMEQEKDKLRADESGWDKVANAFNNTFNCAFLPVEISSFDIELEHNNQVHLNWETESETNNDFFEVQRSSDGRVWETIGKVQGAADAQERNSYAFTDHTAFPGLFYYRLKQVDFDQTYAYSEPQSIQIFPNPNAFSRLYPNPANSYVTIEGTASEVAEITVYNLLGQTLNSRVSFQQNSATSYTIDISNLPDGVYLIHSKQSVKRVYKQAN